MKKNITIACTAASLLLILDSFGMGYKVMLFLLVGIIPGTNIALSPIEMLVLMTALTSIVITRVGILPLVKKYSVTNVVNAKRSKLTPKKLSRA
jgi:hypothetical protein